MKRFLSALALCLLLSACAPGEQADRADAIRKTFASLRGYAAEVNVDVPREDTTLRYTLSVESGDGGTRVTVLAPDELAGVSAVVADGALTLVYDGMALDAGTLSPRVSAVNCVPLLVSAVAEGYVVERGAETLDGVETLRLCFETEADGEKLVCAVWFSADGAPLYAEIASEEKIVLFAEFTSFTFDAIMDAESESERS